MPVKRRSSGGKRKGSRGGRKKSSTKKKVSFKLKGGGEPWDVWNKIITKGESARRKNENGLKVWQSIKDNLPTTTRGEWTSIAESLFDQIVTILGISNDINKDNDIDRSREDYEHIHFILQLGRIPKNKPPSAQSIGQIAFNLGQFKAEHFITPYNQKIIDLVNKNNLYEYKSFVTDPDVLKDDLKNSI